MNAEKDQSNVGVSGGGSYTPKNKEKEVVKRNAWLLAVLVSAIVCVFVCLALISVGLALVIEDHKIFKGAMAIAGAVVCLAVAGYLYSCWQRSWLE